MTWIRQVIYTKEQQPMTSTTHIEKIKPPTAEAIRHSGDTAVSNTTTMRDTHKKTIRILLSFGLLGFFLMNAGLDKTISELSQGNLWLIPVGVIIYLLSQIISSYRWQFLARPLGFDLTLREFYDYYMLGMFFNLFLPGAIGGDVGRMIYLAKSRNKKKREALLTILAERGVGLVALMFLTGWVCLLPVTDPIPNWIRAGILVACFIGLLGFMGLQVAPTDRLVSKFPKLELLASAKIYWKDFPMLVKSVAISLVVHSCMVLIHMLIAYALGIQVPVLYLTAVYGLVSLVSVIPIFFNGIGVREGAYQYLLVLIGFEPPTALAFGLYWFLISTVTSLIGGLILIKGHYKTPEVDSNNEKT